MDQPRNLPGFPTVMMPIRNKSMWPSLKDGQLVWITFMRADYAYEREQIVVFQAPMDDEGHRDADPLYWIKRLIAVAGDIVAIQNNQVSVNGVAVEEPYVADAGSVDVEPTRVPHGHVWVQGDNRPVSFDSRLFGCLPMWRIVGLVRTHRPDDWKMPT